MSVSVEAVLDYVMGVYQPFPVQNTERRNRRLQVVVAKGTASRVVAEGIQTLVVYTVVAPHGPWARVLVG